MNTNRPWTVVALLLAMFMAALEATVVSTAMPTIVGELGGIESYAGVFTAYLLASTVPVPVFGKLADMYGRKPLLLGGIGLFLVGSVLCGTATSMNALIAFRALQGIGAGALLPIVITVVGDLFTFEERARIQGVFGSVWGVAGMVGPVAGGVIVKYLSWPWVFLVNVPFGLLSAFLLVRFLHEKVERKRHVLDFGGAIAVSGAVVSLLVAARGGWISPVAAVLAVVLIGLLVWIEQRAAEPILPIPLFRRRVMAVSSAAGALIGSAMYGAITFVPLFVQAVRGGSPTRAGATITPMIVAWPIASAISGRLLPRFGFQVIVRLGLFLSAAGAAGVAVFLHAEGSLLPTWICMGLFGVGLGFANTALIIAIQTSVAWQERGVATASSIFFRSVGGAIGLGVAGGILVASITGIPGVPRDAARALLGPDHGASLDPALLAKLSGALEGGLTAVFWFVFGLAACAFLLSAFFPRIEPARDAPDAVAAEPAAPLK